MIRRPPRSTRVRSSAASDVYKRQVAASNRRPFQRTKLPPAPSGSQYRSTLESCSSADIVPPADHSTESRCSTNGHERPGRHGHLVSDHHPRRSHDEVTTSSRRRERASNQISMPPSTVNRMANTTSCWRTTGSAPSPAARANGTTASIVTDKISSITTVSYTHLTLPT